MSPIVQAVLGVFLLMAIGAVAWGAWRVVVLVFATGVEAVEVVGVLIGWAWTKATGGSGSRT